MTTHDAPLVLTDVHTAYRRRPVLTGASWRVEPGVTALLGPNGAGKTTLMRTVLGLHPLRGGDISLLGHSVRDDVSRGVIQQQVGFAPQNANLPGLAKVADVVAYAGWLSRMPRPAIADAVGRTLSSLGIADLATRRVRTLSGGQRQRVVLAAALVHNPDILILDEPSAGLDPANRVLLREAILSVSHARTVVLSTHLVEDVEHMADRVGVLSDGQIRFTGTVAELGSLSASPTPGRARPGSAFEQGYMALLDDASAVDGVR